MWLTGHQVLATAEANKALIRLDPLQKLHTLSNLADLLKGGMPGIPRTLRDDSLRADADKIREVRRLSQGHCTDRSKQTDADDSPELCCLLRVYDCCKYKRLAAYGCGLRHGWPESMPVEDWLMVSQEYLVQWVAKVAAAEKEYMTALEHMNRPGTGEQSDAAMKPAGPRSSGAGPHMSPLGRFVTE